jgi:hypothetical protein
MDGPIVDSSIASSNPANMPLRKAGYLQYNFTEQETKYLLNENTSSRGCERRSLRWLLNFRLALVWDAEKTRNPAWTPPITKAFVGPPVFNLESTTAIFSVPKDRLGCRRTRESPGERRSPAGSTAQPASGACSPAARKLRMFARWPHLHRPDPLPSAGAGPAGRIAGRRGHSRRPGAWPGAWSQPTAARVALCAERVLQPRTFPQLNSDDTIYRHDVVHRVSVGRG